MKTESTITLSNVLLKEKSLVFFWFSLISFRLGSDNANEEIPQAYI